MHAAPNVAASRQCNSCGLRLGPGLDSREWLAIPTFASEQGLPESEIRSWVRREKMPGLLRLSTRCLRINVYRFAYLMRLDHTSASSPTATPIAAPLTGAFDELPCPACGNPYRFDPVRAPIVGTDAIARYLELTREAYKKWRQRGQAPQPLPTDGRTLHYRVADIQRRYRIAMLAAEIGAP